MRLLHTCLAASAALTLAGPLPAADLLPPSRPIAEAVDHYIDRQHKEQSVKPAAQADDATLLRRLTLDLAGRIPTAAETQTYLASTDPDKKVKLVDRLMSADGYVRHQVNELDAMLGGGPAQGGRRGPGGGLRDYLGRAVKANRSWDNVFRDVLLADEKEAVRKGSGEFLKARVRDIDRLTTDVSVLFFGVNISCAQCHDHPLVHDWKQDHYYGLKSFFARTVLQGQNLGERDTGVVQFKTTKNVTRTANMMFLTGKKVDAPGMTATPETKRPRAAKGKANEPLPPPKFSARAALAELALQPDQRDFFARAIANRVWHRLFGLGLVTPIDQMHSENAPSHPELLAWLARDTAENGYDLRRLTRGLVLSNAYARASRYEGERWPPPRSFAVARLRALTPHQMATSLRLGVAGPDSFGKADADRRIEAAETAGRGLAALFEQPRDDFQIGVGEALLFSNSERVQRELLTDGAGTLLARMKDAKSPEEAVELAVRNVLSRPATAEERQALVDYLARRADRPAEARKQLLWALLTSAEFRFNY